MASPDDTAQENLDLDPTTSTPQDSAPPDAVSSQPAMQDPAEDTADAAPVRRTRKSASKTTTRPSRSRRATRPAAEVDAVDAAPPLPASSDTDGAVGDDREAEAQKQDGLSLDVEDTLNAVDADAIDVPADSAVPAADPRSSSAEENAALDHSADEPGTSLPEQPAAPAAAFGFGLLFQAPDPEAAANALSRRRARRPAQTAPEPDLEVEDVAADVDDEDDGTAPVDKAPRSASRRRASRSEDAPAPGQAAAEDDGDADDDGDDRPNRRRRRRGGKGRRRAGDDAADEQGGDGPESDSRRDGREADDGQDEDAEGGPEQEDSADDSEGSGRRRTRRRRRSGSGGDSDDPPGTVTKVREPRPPRDEATGIKGSTRLEAKRQRRREGREAGRRRTIITEAEFLARRESVERVMVVRQRDAMTQIGVLEDGVLVEHYISGPGSTSHVAGSSMAGNVYLGRVQNVLPSMEAAFVDIGKGRNAVLYAGEVNWDAAGLEQHKARRIENALSSGQSVLVQVTKDPIGHKGARLTSQVSLPGRYLVYVPDGSMTGISRKLPDTERARLKKILKEVVPDNAGVIVRTAAEGASEAELTADVERLTKEWERIQKKAKPGNAPVLLHGEPDLTVRVVRDVFNEDFSSLVVAGDEAWATVSDYVHSVAPDLADRLTRWTGEKDVFHEHRIDEQLAKAMDRKVWLPSGGSLVIDRTEAMTVIDVNTGKFTGAGGNLEETVTKNNIEAAEEIVRQLRLRDVGGIIVVDFIDMVLEANRDLVVRRLVECLGRDRTKHQVAEVTSLGLVQMTRKRVGAGLIEVFSEPCSSCDGRGLVIQSEPVDRSHGGSNPSGGSSGSSSSNGSGGESGRGRRGRKAKGNADAAGSPQHTQTPQAQAPQAPSGPTPAQIAAAAYAAAVAGHRDESAESDAQVDPQPVTNPDEVVKAIEAALPQSPADTDLPEAKPEPTVGVSHQSAEVVQSAASAPRRRGGRRAVRSAAGSPASAEATVIVAESASNPEVARALADVSSSVAGRDSAVRSDATAGSPEASATEQTPAVTNPEPRRRKRARVIAPAGPPSAAAQE